MRIFLLALLLSGGAFAQEAPELLREFTSFAPAPFSGIRGLTLHGDHVYFTATSAEHSQAIWRTDGSEEGTALWFDVLPGANPAFQRGIVPWGDRFLFAASDGSYMPSLWISDGITNTLLQTFARSPYAAWQSLSLIVPAGELAYFIADGNPRTLWCTDGTRAGTRAVAGGIAAGSAGSIAIFGSKAVVTDREGAIWLADGTTSTAEQLVSFGPGEVSGPIVSDGGRIYFLHLGSSGRSLWTSDGTVAGTEVIAPLGEQDYQQLSGPLSGRILLTGPVLLTADPDGVEELQFDGVSLVGDGPVTMWNGAFYFAATRNGVGGFYRSDGTSAGTIRLVEKQWPHAITSSTSLLYFRAEGDLWATDGTVAGTTSVYVGFSMDGEAGAEVLGDDLLFVYDRSLSLFDGSVSTLVEFVEPPSVDVKRVAKHEGAFVFSIPGYELTSGLWISDGTVDGTVRVAEGPDYSVVARGGADLYCGGEAGLVDVVRTDGTPAGTSPVATADSQPLAGEPLAAAGDTMLLEADGVLYTAKHDVAAEPLATVHNAPYGAVTIGNSVVFSAYGPEGTFLWSSDGTAAGTIRAHEIESPAGPGHVFTFGAGAGTAVFTAYVDGQTSLFRWNSTAAAHSLLRAGLKHDPSHDVGSTLYSPTPIASFMTLSTDEEGVELWRTEGSEATTTLVVDLEPGSGGSYPEELVVVGERVLFRAFRSDVGWELWSTDGTAAGTQLVKDIEPGFASSYPAELSSDGVHVYFSASTQSAGREIWRSDGTTGGTELFLDHVAGSGSSSPRGLQDVGNLLFFAPHIDGVTGLWRTRIGPSPQITHLVPESGPAASAAFAVKGSDFRSGGRLEVGPTRASFDVVDPATINVVATNLTPGTVYEILLVNGDRATAPVGFFADFLDVGQSHPFHRFVETLARLGITAGCGGGNFCEGAALSRAQAAVLLLRSEHQGTWTPPPATGTLFVDVPVSHFAAAWIEQLAADGVTAGCGGGRFCPDLPVTRAQAAVFLLVAKEGASYRPPAATGLFTDVDPSDPFASWIEELARRGITAGCGGGRYCPGNPLTRGQAAVMLVQLFGM